MTLKALLSSLVLGAVVSLAQAHDFKLGNIMIGHPYARATAPGQSVGGAFLTLDNRGADDRLLSATSEMARSVEMHSMSMDRTVMRMRQVDGVAAPAGKVIELKPGGLHIMLMGLKAGDAFPLTLRFEKAGEVTVTVNVDAPGSAPTALKK